MTFAIIAAGEGSRLAAEGVAWPKPLVPLLGEPLVDRLVRIFAACGAERVVMICNEQMTQVQQHMRALQQRDDLPPIELVVRSTPSSMHSFAALAPHLLGGPFCLTTVDTVFAEPEFARYIRAFRNTAADGLMAVTSYVDDEKPLYVSTDASLRITAFNDRAAATDRYVSGGIYCLRPSALITLQHCLQQGVSRMRNFQRALVADGLWLQAYPMGQMIDVDHETDIAKAERLILSSQQTL